MCRELYEHRQWLWTFLEQEVKPTNNAGERALRHAVIWRELSFGTRSARGSRFVETMRTGSRSAGNSPGTSSPTSRPRSERTSPASRPPRYSPGRGRLPVNLTRRQPREDDDDKPTPPETGGQERR